MTASSSVVKLTARTALKKNWLKAVASCMTVISVFIVISGVASLVSYIGGNAAAYICEIALGFLLFLPLFHGLIRFFWRMLFGADDSPVSVFYFFSGKKEYMRAMRLITGLCLRLVFFGIILFLPSVIVDIFGGVKIYDLLDIPIPLWTSNLYYLSLFLKTVASVLLFFIMLRYYAAPILSVADEEMEAAEAIHMSSVIYKRTMLDFIYLFFSFAGWILLSLAVIPLVFTMPYFIAAVCVHTRFAIAEYNAFEELKSTSDIPKYVAGA